MGPRFVLLVLTVKGNAVQRFTRAQLPQIGPATKDYLALEYGITSREALRDFADEHPDEFDDIFCSPGSDLREALKGC